MGETSILVQVTSNSYECVYGFYISKFAVTHASEADLHVCSIHRCNEM
jgi:hypothetical protein